MLFYIDLKMYDRKMHESMALILHQKAEQLAAELGK